MILSGVRVSCVVMEVVHFRAVLDDKWRLRLAGYKGGSRRGGE